MRCKMICESVQPDASEDNPMSAVRFAAKYAPEKDPDDTIYGKYTPSANFYANISTPIAEKLEVGKAYYVDFTVAE